MKTIHLLATIAIALPLCDCRKTSQELTELKQEVATAGDVGFAKETFESLARGDSAVASKIDWEVLTSMDANIGASYVALSSEVEKEQFVNAFITQFATSFREHRGSLENFTNWRVTFHNSLRTEVSADAPDGVLAITVAERNGEERITAIDFTE